MTCCFWETYTRSLYCITKRAVYETITSWLHHKYYFMWHTSLVEWSPSTAQPSLPWGTYLPSTLKEREREREREYWIDTEPVDSQLTHIMSTHTPTYCFWASTAVATSSLGPSCWAPVERKDIYIQHKSYLDRRQLLRQAKGVRNCKGHSWQLLLKS